MKIKKIKARQILDSRGNPTVEADVILENNILGRASVPSGASKGYKEAVELRDGESNYLGLSVEKAIYNIDKIINKLLVGIDVEEQEKIDNIMIKYDNTKNKSKLGANAMLAVSMACLKASSKFNKLEVYQYLKGNNIPKIMVNVLNGGFHASNNLSFQEFMIVPQKRTIEENIQMSSEVFHFLGKILRQKGYSTSVGDEGGYAPEIKTVAEALDLLVLAIKESGYTIGKDIVLAIDVAANSIYKDNKYLVDNKFYTTDELIELYERIIPKYHIVSIEDPFYENDQYGFIKFTEKFGKDIKIVGDDLFVTNKDYLLDGISKKMCNAIIIKPNQIGTFTEVLNVVSLAVKNNYIPILSHRSGETEDVILPHLAVGLDIKLVKMGSMSRGERIAKYNELLRISESLK